RMQAIVGSSPKERFNGLIDEVDLFNRALSASEIQSIYIAGSAGKCPFNQPPPTALGHWKFDETSGTIAYDSAGTNHGTLSASGAAFGSGGISGRALSVSNAANGFVNMGNVLPLTNTDFSLVSWIKMNAGDSVDGRIILSKQVSGFANGYALDANKTGNY